MAQYADDTSFTLLGEEKLVKALVAILDCLCLASDLVLNWEKSSGYWSSAVAVARPQWTQQLNIVWVDEASISKLLGTPFDMKLAARSVDTFLQ